MKLDSCPPHSPPHMAGLLCREMVHFGEYLFTPYYSQSLRTKCRTGYKRAHETSGSPHLHTGQYGAPSTNQFDPHHYCISVFFKVSGHSTLECCHFTISGVFKMTRLVKTQLDGLSQLIIWRPLPPVTSAGFSSQEKLARPPSLHINSIISVLS